MLLKAKLTAISKTEDISIIITLGGFDVAVTLTAFQTVTVALISLLQRIALVISSCIGGRSKT